MRNIKNKCFDRYISHDFLIFTSTVKLKLYVKIKIVCFQVILNAKHKNNKFMIQYYIFNLINL